MLTFITNIVDTQRLTYISLINENCKKKILFVVWLSLFWHWSKVSGSVMLQTNIVLGEEPKWEWWNHLDCSEIICYRIDIAVHGQWLGWLISIFWNDIGAELLLFSWQTVGPKHSNYLARLKNFWNNMIILLYPCLPTNILQRILILYIRTLIDLLMDILTRHRTALLSPIGLGLL